MLTWRMRKSSNMALFIVLSVLLFTGGPAGAACLVEPTSFWELEENSGPFTDSTGSTTGVCGGADTAACPTFNGSGRVYNAQSFDNSGTQAINITGSSSFDWAVDASFTIEFWIMAPDGDVGDNQVVVGRDDSTTDLHWWAGIFDGGLTDVAAFIAIPNTAGPTTAPSLVGITDITDGTWHHVVAVRDAQNLKNYLYVDGVLEGSECITLEGDFQTTAPVNLGYINFNDTPNFHYQGLLDEVAIYSEALSPAVITAHYQNGSLGNTYCAAIVPSITTTDLPDAIIGYTYTADVEAIGNPAPVFSFGGNEPEGMTFSDANNGIIDWQPIDSQAGPVDFTVIATTGVDSDSALLSATVVDVCDDR
ncbi:MAG: LamG domain-containing protein, partial [Thermodesulfobacteriota bacterium]